MRWLRRDESDGSVEYSVKMSADDARSMSAVIGDRLIREVVDDLAKRYVEDNYDELVKDIPKETIVKEVAIKVSERVLEKMFGDKRL